jgi:hypothetical protein
MVGVDRVSGLALDFDGFGHAGLSGVPSGNLGPVAEMLSR